MFIQSEGVQLEASLKEPQKGFRGAAVVCHPHPVFGGTMDNRVVYRAAKAAVQSGFAALRFNFRGAGRSTGQFDQGNGERKDAAAALRWLEGKYPELDYAMIGFSFGAWVGLDVGNLSPRVTALVGLGMPLNLYNFDFLKTNTRPSLYIVGTHDEFCSPENLAQFADGLPASSSVHRIEGSDHFFTGHIEVIETLIGDFFRRL